jgi:hypothetical protein
MIIISRCYINTSKIEKNIRMTIIVDVEIEINREYKVQLNKGFKDVKKYFGI